jgi:alcohol dehydrogenase (cytochrome c)
MFSDCRTKLPLIQALALLPLVAALLPAQVTFKRMLHADREPQNWLTYSGGYASNRYSRLAQVTPENVGRLKLAWVYSPKTLSKMEATPLVVDGVLYTGTVDEVTALDGATGRPFWKYRHTVDPKGVFVLPMFKGLAISGDTLFWATLDAHLIAIDSKTGRVLWDKIVAPWQKGYQLNVAPLIVKDTVILGPATNEEGANCWVAAYDVHTGKERWRFDTAPNSPDAPGVSTWAGDSWKHGGSPIWVTGSYDPETNLTFWGTGNPNPGWNGDPRGPGDNLYSNSVVALNADTGALKWHYQFTPNDEFDWDSVQVPVLTDLVWQAKPRKVMLWANRNGFYYVLDRTTGQFLLGKAFVKQNWNVGFDEKGRPFKAPGFKASSTGTYIEPGIRGGTNWYSPSFSPHTGLFYIPVWDNYSAISAKVPAVWKEGERYTGSRPISKPLNGRAPSPRGPGNYRLESEGYGAVRAIDPATGEKKWDFKMVDYTESGILTTASDVLFAGGKDGEFLALDARDGKLLWSVNLGGTNASGPMTYAAGGQQYVVAAGDSALYVFGLAAD